MEHMLSRLIKEAAPRAPRSIKLASIARSPWVCNYSHVRPKSRHTSISKSVRNLSTSTTRRLQPQGDPHRTKTLSDSSHAQSAANVSQNVTDAEKDHFAKVEEASQHMQVRSPWMREGSAEPPVARNSRSAGAMTKGQLLTTPSRMLKLVLPLTTRDKNRDGKDVEPLALLVHPQQPLSYLERLMQSELPILEDKGRMRAPDITFRAQDAVDEDMGSKDLAMQSPEGEGGDASKDKTVHSKSADQADEDLPTPGKEDARRLLPPLTDSAHPDFVRWSPSTEIGDFIRDAARGKEFAIDIEGASEPIYVGVPTFSDRTYYLRMRLRKTAKRILELADVKRECDHLAQRGAKRVAQTGFLALIGWWGAVYYLTFRTDLGWEVIEPITYLAGLSGIIGGYMWFLWHNREVSYRSAMNITISRRQSHLYEVKGFNIQQWELLIEEGNRLRREIKMVADEYDVEWNESYDEGDEKVKSALRKARKKNGKEDKENDKDDDDDD